MSQGGFNFQTFVSESIQTVKSPSSYYPTMAKEGGMGDPIIRAIIFGVVAGLITAILSFAGIGGLGGAAVGGMVGLASIIITPIFALIGLFIGAIIILIISAIGGGDTKFESNVRVCASLMVMYIVSSITNVFYSINLYLGAIIGIAVSLYGLWLLYNALIHSLKAKPLASKIMTGILAFLVMTMTFGSIAAMKAVESYKDQIESATQDSEFLEQFGENVEDLGEEANKAMEQAIAEMKKAREAQGN